MDIKKEKICSIEQLVNVFVVKKLIETNKDFAQLLMSSTNSLEFKVNCEIFGQDPKHMLRSAISSIAFRKNMQISHLFMLFVLAHCINNIDMIVKLDDSEIKSIIHKQRDSMTLDDVFDAYFILKDNNMI